MSVNSSNTPTRLRRRRIVVGSVVLAAGLLGSWAVNAVWSGKKLDHAPLVEVVQRGDVEETVTATGTLQAFELVNVSAQVTGEVKALHVTLGERVTQGQLIAEIDSSTQRNGLRQAEAQEATAQANLRAKESQLRQNLLA